MKTNIGEIVRKNAGKVALAAFIAGSAAGYELKANEAKLYRTAGEAAVSVAHKCAELMIGYPIFGRK